MEEQREHRQPARVAILGFGKVGSSVARLIEEQHPQSARVTHVFNRNVAAKQASWRGHGICWTERFEDVLSPEVDIVIELVGDAERAYEWVRAALIAGKHVITANKQLIARRGTELTQLAHTHKRRLAYGAAVGGVVPVIPAVVEGLSADSFHRILGILNGTCNYILSKMQTDHADMPEAIREAQACGLAESDPRIDLSGADAAAKLAILSAVAMGRQIHPDQILTASISPVQAIDFHYSRLLRCTIRQISLAQADAGRVTACVQPVLVSLDSPFGAAHGSDNLIAVYGVYSGRLVFSGAGAGGDPTAVAVLSDLLAIRRGQTPTPHHVLSAVEVSSDLRTRHYLRFFVRDQPGIVSGITGVLARYDINIDSVLQSRGHSDERLPFVITTEECAAETMREAVAEIANAPYLVEPPLNLPMLDTL